MPDNGLERYHSALLLLARAQLARHQQLGLEASDLVQQTFAEACRDVKQFRGGTDAERFAWLRQILHHAFLDEYDRQRAGKRDLARQALEADLTDGPAPAFGPRTAAPGSPTEAIRHRSGLARGSDRVERPWACQPLATHPEASQGPCQGSPATLRILHFLLESLVEPGRVLFSSSEQNDQVEV